MEEPQYKFKGIFASQDTAKQILHETEETR